MMKEMNLKKYEAPFMNVTQIKTEDVIMASTLKTIDSNKLMGKGKVNWIDIQ